MMGLTHTAISLAGTAILTGNADLSVLLLAAIGSQIPDLDTTKSWVGKALYPLANFLEERYPHRSATHSIFLSLAIATLTLPAMWVWSWQLWAALPLGHLLSCFSDCSTKLGCQFFWPINKDNWVIGLNPQNRLETGKAGDYAILASAVCIFCVTFYLITGGGGIGGWINKTIFPNEKTTVELLQQENGKAIAVQIEGIRKIDNSRINDKFWAVGANGGVLIVRSSQNQMMRVGSSGEIIAKRVDVLPDRLAIKTRQQRIEEAEAGEWIRSLPAEALVSGILEIEDSSEINLPIATPGVMVTVNKSANGVSLDYASKNDLKPLEEFFILGGEVVIKQL
jgi:inner membrane protein